jgi:hypothetical protein
VPDGYEIKIETHSIYNGKDNPSIEYAILVPKQVDIDPDVKDALNKGGYWDLIDDIPKQEPVKEMCGSDTCPDDGACEHCQNPVKQPASIEEAAEKSWNLNHIGPDNNSYNPYAYKAGFIAGAKSDAAKDYWYEQFKQEKK